MGARSRAGTFKSASKIGKPVADVRACDGWSSAPGLAAGQFPAALGARKTWREYFPAALWTGVLRVLKQFQLFAPPLRAAETGGVQGPVVLGETEALAGE